MQDKESHPVTEEELRERTRLNQILVDSLPCVALVLRSSTREIVASNQAAVKVGAIPGRQCLATWGQGETPCPWCLAPTLWETGEPQHLEVEAGGIVWDAYWSPAGPDLYLHFAFDITERRKAEKALQENEKRFRDVLENAQKWIWEVDAQGKYTFCSPMVEKFLGYTPKELFGKHFFELFHPSEREELTTAAFKVFASKEPFREFLNRNIHKNGESVWLLTSGVPILDEKGNLLGYRGVDTNFTKHKEAEEALQESEEKYRFLVNQIPAVVFTGYGDWSVDFFDQKIEALTGYPKEEFDSRKIKWSDLILPEDLGKTRRTFIEALNTTKSYMREYRIRKKDGEIRWIQALGGIFCDDAGKVDHVNGVFFDITDHKRMEEGFRVLVNHAPMGIFIVQDGKFQLINPGFEKITGYTAQELLGHNSLNLVSRDYREMVRENAVQMLKGSLEMPIEFPIITKSGETKWVMEKVIGTICHGRRAALGYFLDISDHKSLEEQLLQAQKMEAVGRLAGGVAHDFNNLLSAIMGYVELIKMRMNEADPCLHYVEETMNAMQRAAALTRQLLTFSHKQILQPQVINLNFVINELGKMLRRLISENIELTIVLDQELGLMKADPGQIEQVIMNLVINASDAMPSGGNITIRTDDIYLDNSLPLKNSGALPGNYVVLMVSDTGMGMDAETLSHVFEPFFTTKKVGQGTGLGLSTVYGIIKHSGGYIEVDSNPGMGTTFKIYLPQFEGAVQPKEKHPPSFILSGSETILLVEDDEALRTVITQFLEKYGYSVLQAKDGSNAMIISESHEGPIHLLLTDIVMPHLSGLELAKLMARFRPEVKVIHMSGYSEAAILDPEVLDYSTFLQKPFKPIDLVLKIRAVLDDSLDR